MNIERIRRRLKGGFRPFFIRTSDGQEYAVPHPEFVMVAATSLAVVDADKEIVVIDPLHIVAVKNLPVAKANGS